MWKYTYSCYLRIYIHLSLLYSEEYIGHCMKMNRMFNVSLVTSDHSLWIVLQIAAESISSIRTVQSLGKEKLFYEKYKNTTDAPHKWVQVLNYNFVEEFSKYGYV